jgi:RNA recognition motif-containing protein
VRTAAGKTWVDPTLADWPDDDFRLFVGNADPAVSDEQLYEHFRSRFASTRRARIVRDQHGKSRGYGFVSLSDALECAQALRTMDQTWLGGRPVRVKRSHWKDREWKERKKSEKQRNKKARRWGML